MTQVAGQVRVGNGSANATIPLGGLNMIMFWDLHQFPPVKSMNGALYCGNKSIRSSIGQAIYEQFETVMTLKQQMRITDAEWVEILERSRIGECTEDDLKEMKKLVLTNAECEVPDFTSTPWNKAILVTPCHSICTYWNAVSLWKHCTLTGNTLYSCDTEDSYGQD
jgi:hypothetical protein